MDAAIGIGILVVLGFISLFTLPKKLSGANPSIGGAGIVAAAKYPYADLINKWASKYGVDPDLVAAHAKVETNFHPEKINEEDPGLDYDSSYGIMQVQLATAQDFGKVMSYRLASLAEIAWLMDVSNNIQVGAWNVARWQHKYLWDVAVQMYNVGENGYNNKGRRNAEYLRRVREAFNVYNAT